MSEPICLKKERLVRALTKIATTKMSDTEAQSRLESRLHTMYRKNTLEQLEKLQFLLEREREFSHRLQRPRR